MGSFRVVDCYLKKKKKKLVNFFLQAEISHTGGAVRRTHRKVRKDDVETKLLLGLKRMGLMSIPDISEVLMIKDNSSVIHFSHPKVCYYSTYQTTSMCLFSNRYTGLSLLATGLLLDRVQTGVRRNYSLILSNL